MFREREKGWEAKEVSGGEGKMGRGVKRDGRARISTA